MGFEKDNDREQDLELTAEENAKERKKHKSTGWYAVMCEKASEMVDFDKKHADRTENTSVEEKQDAEQEKKDVVDQDEEENWWDGDNDWGREW
jgi:hypothetical protein